MLQILEDDDATREYSIDELQTFNENDFVCDMYIMCREGMMNGVALLIEHAEGHVGRKRVCELLNKKCRDDHQICAPLLIAAKEGHVEICIHLLYEYHVDKETEGVVVFDGYKIEGATPLWCAAASNHTMIAMMLIKCGADVNHATASGSTPLRAACFDGKMEIVEILLDHKADLNIANKFYNTCLMISAYKGHRNVVKCLLEHGAPPDPRALLGNTALQFAAERGHVEIILDLIEYGASILTTNNYNLTPIMSAAARIQDEVVEFFLAQPEYSCETKIDALELLGASFANDKDSYDLEKCYYYLHLAMIWRCKDPDNVLQKVLPPPVPAYENRIECRNFEELLQIKYNANALQMESLAIRERILGPLHPEVPDSIIFRGAVFADSANFERCLDLWLHALALKERGHVCSLRDLLRFAQVFCQMMRLGVTIPIDVFTTILRTAVLKLEQFSERQAQTVAESTNDLMLTCLYLTALLAKLIPKLELAATSPTSERPLSFSTLAVPQGSASSASRGSSAVSSTVGRTHNNDLAESNAVRNMARAGTSRASTAAGGHSEAEFMAPAGSPEAPAVSDCLSSAAAFVWDSPELLEENSHVKTVFELRRLVYRLMRTRCRAQNGNTLLHLAVDSQSAAGDFHTRNVCHFPCAHTARLLIECGADVNIANNQGDTPLHLIAAYSKPITDFMTLNSIISALIEGGAHADFTNKLGKTPMESAKSGVAELMLRTNTAIALKCLAARAIHRHSISFDEDFIIPRELVSFVQMHGPRRDSSAKLAEPAEST